MPYTIKVGEVVYNTADLKLVEALAIEKETGETWLYINPLRSAAHNIAITRAFLLRDKSASEAQAVIDGLTVDAVIENTNVVDDDLPDTYVNGIPKAEGVPSTPTSSPVPVGSDGHLT